MLGYERVLGPCKNSVAKLKAKTIVRSLFSVLTNKLLHNH